MKCLLSVRCGGVSLALFVAGVSVEAAAAKTDQVLDLGSRRELFVDEFLIERNADLELKLHSSIPKEIVMLRDAPWEGSGSGFETLFRDGNIIRMYYIGAELTNADGTTFQYEPVSGNRRQTYACYAESKDGIHWTKPVLGLFEFNGSKQNNIIWSQPRMDNFTPFKDPNPACRPGEEYKAVGVGVGGLLAFKSSDGIQWSNLGDKPIITRGKFDTQNNAFWDPVRKHYWCYVRDFHDREGAPTNETRTGIRDVLVSTSTDFITWSEPRRIEYPGSPDEALYTNVIAPYYRAPQIFLGFPLRYSDRKFSRAAMAALPDPEHRQRRMKFSPRYGTVVTDSLFMTSRDGRTYFRWNESFHRPGPQRRDNWVYGDCVQSLGFLETPAEDPTAEPELSLYVHENHWKGPNRLRRHTIRLDGFVSLHARQKPGEFVSKLLAFSGRNLTLNFATSAAGSIRVELQGADDRPLPGFSLAECDELFGDTVDRTVTWADRADVGAFAGKPVRLRMVLCDADLYSLKFQE
jgi:hypothetical protein